MISDLEAANEMMGESAELLGKTRRNELISEDMEVTEGDGDGDGGGGGARGSRS